MSPVALVLSTSLVALYALWATTVPWPLRRTLAFTGGVVALTLAPLCDTGSLPSHMLEHGILMSVAAPLIAFSAPLSLCSRTMAPRRRARLRAVLASRGARITARAMPVVFVPAVWALHAPSLSETLERMPLAHAAEHLAFTALAAGVWSIAFGRLPGAALSAASRGLVLLALAPACDMAAIALMVWGEPGAAAVMLVSTLPFALAGAALLWRSASSEERIAALVEAPR